ncbi:MAG: hypothetical protein DME50_17330, partial [Verrucomicrobia bacterium]
QDLNTGGRYDPATDTWAATNLNNAPPARDFHTAVWTGTEMIIWGGAFSSNVTDTNTGGRYCAQSGPPPTPTPTVSPTPSPTPTPTPTPRVTPRPRPSPHPRPTPQ